MRNGNSLPALFDPNFKYGLLTPNIERALSLQRIWKFGLLAPYVLSLIFKQRILGNETDMSLIVIVKEKNALLTNIPSAWVITEEDRSEKIQDLLHAC